MIAASAASIPDFIAVWVPLIFGTLRKPAESPINAPERLNWVGLIPPSDGRAPYATRRPPSKRTDGRWVLNRAFRRTDLDRGSCNPGQLQIRQQLGYFQMVDERAAIGIEFHGQRWCDDGALIVFFRINFPKFFDANAIGLQVGL